MPDRFKLKYYSSGILSIRWAHERLDYVSGDCYVLACREASDTSKLDAHASPAAGWSQTMTLAEARAFIASRPKMLGTRIRDCHGLSLLDEDRVVDFAKTVEVRKR